MRLTIDVLLDYAIAEPCDVLLQIEAAADADQRLIEDTLTVTSREPLRAVAGEEGVDQRCWVLAEGHFVAEYRGIIEINRAGGDIAGLPLTAPRDLSAALVPYVMPSRYCESDRLETLVEDEFGTFAGGAKALAIRDWVAAHLTYESGTSAGVTTAIDTLVSRKGVCRDYAHLTVALLRAAAIPARCAAGYSPGVDPQDFHAVAEAWLDGAWHLLDATGMATPEDFARVAVGRDATDIAFMTIFGAASLQRQSVRVVVG